MLLVQLPNSVEQYIVYLAALRLGVIVSPLPVQYREFELRHVLAISQARAVVTASRVLRHAAVPMWLDLAGQVPPGFEVLAFGADVPAPARALDALLDAHAGPGVHAQAAGVGANDIATLCWT